MRTASLKSSIASSFLTFAKPVIFFNAFNFGGSTSSFNSTSFSTSISSTILVNVTFNLISQYLLFTVFISKILITP